MDDALPDPSRRFGGADRLYTALGAQRMRAAHVAVIGIGGVGSWAAEALARTGLGRITLIDLDHVAESNVNRQIHATTETLGMAKITAMEQRIASINPGCQVNGIDAFVEPSNWPAILPADVDGVIDACDQMPAKVAMAAWSLAEHRIPFITVGAAGGKRRPEALDIADLSACVHDPLMAKLRYQLRRNHGAAKGGKRMGLTCVYSAEPMTLPVRTEETLDAHRVDSGLNCRGYGSVVTVTATCGMLAAGWILNKLSGVAQ